METVAGPAPIDHIKHTIKHSKSSQFNCGGKQMQRQFQDHMASAVRDLGTVFMMAESGLSRESKAWKSERRDQEEFPGDGVT